MGGCVLRIDFFLIINQLTRIYGWKDGWKDGLSLKIKDGWKYRWNLMVKDGWSLMVKDGWKDGLCDLESDEMSW